jgi:hypothetical protein
VQFSVPVVAGATLAAGAVPKIVKAAGSIAKVTKYGKGLIGD